MLVAVSPLVPVFNVVCVMCGRSAGQVVQARFVKSPQVRAPQAGRDGPRCGECAGNLYLEPDESVTAFMATQLAHRQAVAASAAPARAA
jgi:hypothetical protein